MGIKWLSTKIKGIRFREHPTRKHGIRKDRYYAIRYQHDGKRVEEGLGWTSEGWTLDKANLTLAKLREASVTGDGPVRLGEKRKAAKKKKEKEAAKDISFSCIFDQFLAAGNKTKNARVLAVQQGYGEKWLLPTVGDMPIRKITASHLEAIQKEILEAGRSRQTAAHAIDIFRAAWNWGYKRELIEGRNPVSQMERVRPNGARERFFTPEELHKLLDWLQNEDLPTYHLTLCAAHTGARLGELAQLTWDRVNIDLEQIDFIHTKTNRPRSVPMTAELRRMFEAMGQGEAGSLVFLKKNRSPWFTYKDGRMRTDTPPVFRRALAALQLNVGHKANRTKLTFHCLRHTAATMLLANGVDPVTVQSILGWSTLRMLERYAHAIPATKRQAISQLERSLSGQQA